MAETVIDVRPAAGGAEAGGAEAGGAESFLSIWPTGQPQPLVSSLNWMPGRTTANAVTVNAVTVKVGTGGKISVFNPTGEVEVIADTSGRYG